jgi:threonylcarbamoyladenosine tRNA methylthiotransferase MtaB
VIRVAIATLGCKTNTYESSAIAAQFDPQTHCLVPFNEPADIYIINTCTVTGRTDFKSRNLIRKALERKQADPSVRVVVTGCYAQREPEEIREMGGIDLIVDNQNKQDIARLLNDTEYAFADIMAAKDFIYRPVGEMVGHTRAFQKIQDGCDFRCSYCAIPYGRGNSRSARFGDVVSQAKLFVENGYREIVLGGVNLGLYKDGRHGLADVVEALRNIQGLELIRLSSLEPQLVTPELLSRISACEKLCHHFHLALQSGCDGVLKRMNRDYGTREVKELLSEIHRLMPHAAIGMDVITGFPGEDEGEFEATRAFLDGLDIAYLHVFSFSRRRGTPADSLPGQVSNQEKKRRAGILTQLGARKKNAYKDRLIAHGVKLRGVSEKLVKGRVTFLSDHYVRVYAKTGFSQGELLQIVPTRKHLDGVR